MYVDLEITHMSATTYRKGGGRDALLEELAPCPEALLIISRSEVGVDAPTVAACCGFISQGRYMSALSNMRAHHHNC
jgi:hypothetical protein